MSDHDFHWQVFVLACEIDAAWRCQLGAQTLTPDLRRQLERLTELLDERMKIRRPLGVATPREVREQYDAAEWEPPDAA